MLVKGLNISKCLERLVKDVRVLKTPCRASSSTKDGENKLYEVRHYRVHSHEQRRFLDLTVEHIHVRRAHSKMVGFWYTELGDGINDVVHIWEYDSLSHRAAVRKGLAGDRQWQEGFMARILPMMLTQKTTLMACFPGTQITYPDPDTGHYEMQTVQFEGPVEQAGRAVTSLQLPGATLRGAWYNIFSYLDQGLLLWHHQSLDHMVCRPHVPPSTGLKVTKSRLLVPMKYSPMR